MVAEFEPSRKRAAPAASTTKEAKRSKPSEAGKANEPAQTTNVDITAQNAVNSPLLRLPAELRNKIWNFCYGGMMITVVGTNRSRTCFQFRPYDSVPSDQETVDLVGEGFKRLADTPQLVCKQFWSESTTTFFATATFNFFSPVVFIRLTAPLRTPLWTWVQHVRRLRVTVEGYNSMFMILWADGFTDTRLALFTHLEGVELRIIANHYELLRLERDIKTSKEWKGTSLPLIIRSFQQHKLKPELTRFICEEPHVCRRQKNPLADAIGEAIRAEPLKHHPQAWRDRIVSEGPGPELGKSWM